ncbi:MAG: response regulator [Sumerlaeia bacterium]
MKTILVIDDEREVLEIVRTVLKTKGYKIQCAEGGEAGLKLAEELEPDLIVCDLMMPRVSGMEVVKRLKRHQRLRRIPIVVLSAFGADDKRPPEFWARGLGVDDFLSKPFDPLDLLGRVEYIFRRDEYVSTRAETADLSAVKDLKRKASETQSEYLDLSDASPSDIARAYIESWNAQDFVTEFRTLSEELTGGLSESDYVLTRLQTYQAEDGAYRQQRLAKVTSESISGFIAKVIGERHDIVGRRETAKEATITMKKTQNGWRIVRYTEKPLTSAG